MARSSADDFELRRACEVAIDAAINKQKVVLSIRVAKSRGVWGKTSKLGRQMAKPRVLALTTKAKGPKIKAFLRVLKDSGGGGVLEPAKIYKLKHLSKVEVLQNDPSGCSFMLGFDNLRSQSVAPPQWTMRNKGDRNRILLCILNMSKEILGRLPKVVGIDIVEMTLWAKENNTAVSSQVITHGGQDASGLIQGHSQVTVERDLVSQAEEEDMEALLGTYVMGIGEAKAFSERLKRELLALEAANVHALVECESIIEEDKAPYVAKAAKLKTEYTKILAMHNKNQTLSVVLEFWKSFSHVQTLELLQLNSADLIVKGNLYTRSCEDAVSKLLEKALKIQLGRGF